MCHSAWAARVLPSRRGAEVENRPEFTEPVENVQAQGMLLPAGREHGSEPAVARLVDMADPGTQAIDRQLAFQVIDLPPWRRQDRLVAVAGGVVVVLAGACEQGELVSQGCDVAVEPVEAVEDDGLAGERVVDGVHPGPGRAGLVGEGAEPCGGVLVVAGFAGVKAADLLGVRGYLDECRGEAVVLDAAGHDDRPSSSHGYRVLLLRPLPAVAGTGCPVSSSGSEAGDQDSRGTGRLAVRMGVCGAWRTER